MVSRRTVALLVIGLVFVTVPLYGPWLDITGTDQVYRSALLQTDGNELRVAEGNRRFVRDVTGIDCFRSLDVNRQCVLESALLNGSRRIDYPPISAVTGEVLFSGDNYVSFRGGAVYRRTANWRDGAFVLGLERVPPERALQNVSIPFSVASQPVQQAIETGSVRTDNELSDDALLVSTQDQYYVVYSARTRQFLSEKPFTERLLEIGATAIGAWLLVAAGVRLQAERADGD